MSDSLQPHELQHTRPPCPSPTPGVYSNSCPLVMPSNHLILCHPLLLAPSIFPSIRVLGSTWYETSNGISLKAGPVLKMPKRRLQNQDWGIELACLPWGILWPGEVTSLGPLSSLPWAAGPCPKTSLCRGHCNSASFKTGALLEKCLDFKGNVCAAHCCHCKRQT